MMVTEERIGVPFVRNYEGVFANSVFVLFGLDYVKLLIVVVVADVIVAIIVVAVDEGKENDKCQEDVLGIFVLCNNQGRCA